MIVIDVILCIVYAISFAVMTGALLGAFLKAKRGELKGKELLFTVAVLGSTLALIDKLF